MAGLRAQDLEYLFQGLGEIVRQGGGRAAALGTGTFGIIHQLRRNLLRGQHIVHQTSPDGASWHAVEFGRCQVLGDDQTTGVLNCFQSQCPIGTGSGKDNANRVTALVFGQ